MHMTLDRLLHSVELVAGRASCQTIDRVTFRPEHVSDTALLVLYPHSRYDYALALRALRQPPAAILASSTDNIEYPYAPILRVENVPRAYARLCATWWGDAHRALRLIGITGTKGKTTATHLIHAVLSTHDRRCGLASTLVRQIGRRRIASRNTTPEPYELHELLAVARQSGATSAAIEVSSIGIAESRVHDLRFTAAVFTNLGMDHWTYHGSRDDLPPPVRYGLE